MGWLIPPGRRRRPPSPLASWTPSSPSAVSHPPLPLALIPRTRRGLALRAEIAAAAGNNHTPDRRPAAVAAVSFASIRPIVPLIFSRLALDVKQIGNRRPARQNRLPQNPLQG